MNRQVLRSLILVSGLALGLTACSTFWSSAGIGSLLDGGFESNGERIYFTAITERGTRIRSRGGAAFGGMMRGRQTCASCHGTDGQGGAHLMHMQAMDAPDIRWDTLSSSEHGGHDEADEDAEELPYDEETFMRALREGITPGGERLSRNMPQWEMSDEDVEDLIAFLKTLP